MNTQRIPADDARLRWPGAVSLETTAAGVAPWRLPITERSLFHPELQIRAAMPAGVRLTFRTNSARLAGQVVVPPESPGVDLVCDGELLGTQPLDGRERFEFADLPRGDKHIELWLPQFGAFTLRHLELDAGATVEPVADNRPRWITYGSSITQCRTAASPSATWPAIVARARNLNLTCLGFGGQCHLDLLVARLIRDLPADYISLCVGINIQGAASLGPRTFASSIIGFVKLIREKHPATPLLVCSPIFSFHRETGKNVVGLSLADMREQVGAAVTTLREAGDPAIQYQSGLALFGPDLGELMPDELHPDAAGYRRLAENFLAHAAPKLFERPPAPK